MQMTHKIDKYPLAQYLPENKRQLQKESKVAMPQKQNINNDLNMVFRLIQ